MEKLLDMLDDNDDVQSVWHNWDRPEEDEKTKFRRAVHHRRDKKLLQNAPWRILQQLLLKSRVWIQKYDLQYIEVNIQ